MKPRTAILVGIFPVVSAIVALRILPNRDVTITSSTIVDPSSESRKPISVADPVLAPEIEFPTEWLASEDFSVPSEDLDALKMRLLGLLEEEFRASIDEDVRLLWSTSPFAANERAAEEMDRYREDPAWPRISAVPRVTGFEIQVCPQSECISDWLAEERDDVVWARPMEARIMDEIASHAETGLAQLFVVCRQVTCGIVLPPSDGEGSLQDLLVRAKALGDTLGFARYSVADRADFQAIYLTTRDQSPEKWVQ